MGNMENPHIKEAWLCAMYANPSIFLKLKIQIFIDYFIAISNISG